VTGRDEQTGNAVIVHCILGVSAVSTIHTYGRGCQWHQGREIIAIVPLENGAFCTIFSENFHKF
jgi:hypothetical protein